MTTKLKNPFVPLRAILGGSLILLAVLACKPAEEVVPRDEVERKTERLAEIALTEQKQWLRVIGQALMIQLYPLVTDGPPDKQRLASMGLKLEQFISLNGEGIWALHVSVKQKVRKNPGAEFEPFMLSWYENSKRRTSFGAKAIVPDEIKQKYAKETVKTTFSNGTRTDVRLDIYYRDSLLKAKLKAQGARLKE